MRKVAQSTTHDVFILIDILPSNLAIFTVQQIVACIDRAGFEDINIQVCLHTGVYFGRPLEKS